MHKKLVLLWTRTCFSNVHLKKDTGLFPLWIAKEYGISCEIVFTDFPGNTAQNDIEGIVKITRIPNKHSFTEVPSFSLFHLRRYFRFIRPYLHYLKVNKNTVSHYMFFHASETSLFLSYVAKKYNKNVKTWIKMDANMQAAYGLQKLYAEPKRLKQKIRQAIFKKMATQVSLFSTESNATYEIISNTEVKYNNTIRLIPNGIEFSGETGDFQKEKMMISVGRLGSRQKNMQVLLDALESVDLRDWKIYLIGSPQTEDFDFQSAIDTFYARHPEKKDAVVVTGNISSKETLSEFYKKSSVFLMPSEQEGFPLSAVEAMSYGNYLILSAFSSAQDFVPSDAFGFILPESRENAQNRSAMTESLSLRMQDIINGKIDVCSARTERIQYFQKKFSIQEIVRGNVFSEWMLHAEGTGSKN